MLEGGTGTVGGLSGFYGSWQVTCKDTGRTFTAQRWLLPRSRIGIVSYALTPASAADIKQMVTTMDLARFTPTKPK